MPDFLKTLRRSIADAKSARAKYFGGPYRVGLTIEEADRLAALIEAVDEYLATEHAYAMLHQSAEVSDAVPLNLTDELNDRADAMRRLRDALAALNGETDA